MARYDKMHMVVRAIAGTALTGVKGVRFDANGEVVYAGTAAGQTAIGVVCLPGTIAAGDPVGVLVRGEIVEFGGSAGSVYYAGSNGTISTDSTSATQVGVTVEGNRLVVLL